MENGLYQKLAAHKNKILILGVVFFILDILVWIHIGVLHANAETTRIYFLDVGQGDSELVLLPHNVKLLIDGGPPNGMLLHSLENILPFTDRYIDLVMLSHPQLDHFGGLIDLLKRYRVGAFLWNAREGTAQAFTDLVRVMKEKRIVPIKLMKGDNITYGTSVIPILSPDNTLIKSKELNDTMVVAELKQKNFTALFTGDIGTNVEDALLQFWHEHIDVLKVAHHGSKFSSGSTFLSAILPKIAVIEVGAHNLYGHPTKEALSRLQDAHARVFRTDQNGTVEVSVDSGRADVFTER